MTNGAMSGPFSKPGEEMKINHEYAHHVYDEVRGRLGTAVENLEAARRTLDELGYDDDHDIPMEVSTAYLDEYEIAALLLRAGTHLKALRTNWLVEEVLPAPKVAV